MFAVALDVRSAYGNPTRTPIFALQDLTLVNVHLGGRLWSLLSLRLGALGHLSPLSSRENLTKPNLWNLPLPTALTTKLNLPNLTY